MCVYVCVCVCMFMHARVYMCVYICVCVNGFVSVRMCSRVYMRVQVCAGVCVYTCIIIIGSFPPLCLTVPEVLGYRLNLQYILAAPGTLALFQ